MNMFVFTPKIFEILEEGFVNFFKDNEKDLSQCEYLIPDVVCKNIEKNNIKVKVLRTTAKWQGITYKDDKEVLVKGLNDLVKKKEYPNRLWD